MHTKFTSSVLTFLFIDPTPLLLRVWILISFLFQGFILLRSKISTIVINYCWLISDTNDVYEPIAQAY